MRPRFTWLWLIACLASAASFGNSAEPVAASDHGAEQSALHRAFPTATAFEPVVVQPSATDLRTVVDRARSTARGKQGPTWAALRDGQLEGVAYLDHVIGRTEYITWLCAIGSDGLVRSNQILIYREPIGGEIDDEKWLRQFTGIGPDDTLRRGRPITPIAGATMSVDAIVERTRLLLDWHAVVVMPHLRQRYGSAALASVPGQPIEWALPVGTSTLHLRLHAPQPLNADVHDALLAAGRTAAARWERILNQWNPGSELATVQQAGGGAISAELSQALDTVDAWHRLSGGVHDPTVGPLILAWQASADAGRIDDKVTASAARSIGWSRIRWAPGARTLTMPSGMALDLGSLLKGWIIDAVADAMQPLLPTGSRLDLDYGGSSQRTLSADQPLTIALRHPGDVGLTQGGRTLPITLQPGQALGVAHAAGRTFRIGDAIISHLIDPRSGQPADVRRSAVIIAPTATEADVLDTTCCVLPIPEALALLDRQPGTAGLLWDGERFHPSARWTAPIP
jgi:FAD:protein FMN transferase